jgi:hypothetical protein
MQGTEISRLQFDSQVLEQLFWSVAEIGIEDDKVAMTGKYSERIRVMV